MKIVIREESGVRPQYDILDQTRIHHEHYMLAGKIATDACHVEGETKDNEKANNQRFVKEVLACPQKLANLEVN